MSLLRTLGLCGIVSLLMVGAVGRPNLRSVGNCSYVDCSKIQGATEMPADEFRRKVMRSFVECGQIYAEDSCDATAEYLFARVKYTSSGARCLTKEDFKATSDLGGIMIRDKIISFPPPDDSLPIPPPPPGGRRLVQAPRNQGLSRVQMPFSSRNSYPGCGELPNTGPGMEPYPKCALLVCSQYGIPQYFPGPMQDCCYSNRYFLGSRWDYYCVRSFYCLELN